MTKSEYFIIYILEWFGMGMLSISFNYSMYLMQHHNTNQYRKFLKFLYISKLYYICCCCCFKGTIIYELAECQLNEIINNDNNKTARNSDIETKDKSIKMDHSKHKSLELSIATNTITNKQIIHI